VTNLERAESFYGNVLGFRLLEKGANTLVFDTGVVRLYINKDDHVVPFIPALEVHDYDEAKTHLIQNGCEIIREFEGHKALYFRDPFGITIDMIERRK
jgi:catechol 2,3-dioxygenase-like lactoylglutathione lyase family enzyme